MHTRSASSTWWSASRTVAPPSASSRRRCPRCAAPAGSTPAKGSSHTRTRGVRVDGPRQLEPPPLAARELPGAHVQPLRRAPRALRPASASSGGRRAIAPERVEVRPHREVPEDARSLRARSRRRRARAARAASASRRLRRAASPWARRPAARLADQGRGRGVDLPAPDGPRTPSDLARRARRGPRRGGSPCRPRTHAHAAAPTASPAGSRRQLTAPSAHRDGALHLRERDLRRRDLDARRVGREPALAARQLHAAAQVEHLLREVELADGASACTPRTSAVTPPEPLAHVRCGVWSNRRSMLRAADDQVALRERHLARQRRLAREDVDVQLVGLERHGRVAAPPRIGSALARGTRAARRQRERRAARSRRRSHARKSSRWCCERQHAALDSSARASARSSRSRPRPRRPGGGATDSAKSCSTSVATAARERGGSRASASGGQADAAARTRARATGASCAGERPASGASDARARARAGASGARRRGRRGSARGPGRAAARVAVAADEDERQVARPRLGACGSSDCASCSASASCVALDPRRELALTGARARRALLVGRALALGLAPAACAARRATMRAARRRSARSLSSSLRATMRSSSSACTAAQPDSSSACRVAQLARERLLRRERERRRPRRDARLGERLVHRGHDAREVRGRRGGRPC